MAEEPQKRAGPDWESWIAIIADLCVVISIVVGIATYLDQRRVSEEQKKRETALQFVALRNQDAYVAAEESFFESITKNQRYKIQWGNQEEAKERDKQEIIAEIGLGKIDSLAKFYSSVALCVKDDLCDREIVSRLFDRDMKFFYCATHDKLLPAIAQRLYSDEQPYAPLSEYFVANIKSCPRGPTVGAAS